MITRSTGIVLGVLIFAFLASFIWLQILTLVKSNETRIRTLERIAASTNAAVGELVVSEKDHSVETLTQIGQLSGAIAGLEATHHAVSEKLMTKVSLASRNQQQPNVEFVRSKSNDHRIDGDDPHGYVGDETGGPEFFALTYASHGGSDDYFCRSLRSALKQGVPIRLLGWNSNNVQLVRKVCV